MPNDVPVSTIGVQADICNTVSASQISTYERCPRKWWYLKVANLEAPSGPGAALGSEVHAVLEQYLRDGTPVPDTRAGNIARKGLPLLPVHPQQPGIEIEREFWLTIHDERFHGKKDVEYFDILPVVIDHKTTGSPKYAKTADTLLSDPQATLYAADAMLRHSTDRAQLTWIYYSTRDDNKAWTVARLVTREDVEPRLEQSLDTARSMRPLRLVSEAVDVPANLEACDDFGGCPFENICPKPRKPLWRTDMPQAPSLDELLGTPAPVRANGINPPPPPKGSFDITPIVEKAAAAVAPEASAIPTATPEPKKTTKRATVAETPIDVATLVLVCQAAALAHTAVLDKNLGQAAAYLDMLAALTAAAREMLCAGSSNPPA